MGSAHAQQVSIRSCLEGWDLKLTLPYFPRYRAVSCRVPEEPPVPVAIKAPAGPRYFSGKARSVQLDLAADVTALTAALADPGDAKAAAVASSFAHFDALLKAAGMQRVDAEEGRGATYEASRPAGKLRVVLNWSSQDRLVIALEQVPTLAQGVVLPKPDAEFRFHDVSHAPLFLLPRAQLVTEEMRYGDQQSIAIDNPEIARKSVRHAGEVSLWLPQKAVVLRYPAPVTPTEAELAMNEALHGAGWIVTRAQSGDVATIEARFSAAGRNIDLEARFYFDGYVGFTQGTILLRDPVFQRRQAPMLATFETLGEYTMAPVWNGAALSADSTFNLHAASHYFKSKRARVHTQGTYTVHLAPVASGAEQAERAKAMASRLRDELLRMGWEDKRVFVDDGVRAPGPDAAGLAAGVQLVFYECGTRGEDRPGGVVVRCQCWREHGERWNRPGSCM